MNDMVGNPKRSPWYVTRQAQRGRKLVSLTLSDEARELLEHLSEERGEAKSQIVEELIVREARKKGRGKR